MQCGGWKKPSNRKFLLRYGDQHYKTAGLGKVYRRFGFSPSTLPVLEEEGSQVLMGGFTSFEHTANEMLHHHCEGIAGE
jgi:hypothetical protein